jgi:hypothetical protein
MFRIAQTGEQMARMTSKDCPARSASIDQPGSRRPGSFKPAASNLVDRELFNDGICQQFGREFGDPVRHRIGLVNGFCELDLEPLPLSDRENLGEPEPVARSCDGLTLRIVDLRLQHHVDDESGHIPNSTPGTLLNCGRDPSRSAVALKGKP